jgi:hypothetical protein
MYYSLDRIEGNFAVMVDDNGDHFDVNIDNIDENHRKEGSVFRLTEGSIFNVKKRNLVYDSEETERRIEIKNNLLKKLFNEERNNKI